jgi:hypothetical protein
MSVIQISFFDQTSKILNNFDQMSVGQIVFDGKTCDHFFRLRRESNETEAEAESEAESGGDEVNKHFSLSPTVGK